MLEAAVAPDGPVGTTNATLAGPIAENETLTATEKDRFKEKRNRQQQARRAREKAQRSAEPKPAPKPKPLQWKTPCELTRANFPDPPANKAPPSARTAPAERAVSPPPPAPPLLPPRAPAESEPSPMWRWPYEVEHVFVIGAPSSARDLPGLLRSRDILASCLRSYVNVPQENMHTVTFGNGGKGKHAKLEDALASVGPSPERTPRCAWIIGHGGISPSVIGATDSCHMNARTFIEHCGKHLAPLYGVVLCTCHAAALAKSLQSHRFVAVRAPWSSPPHLARSVLLSRRGLYPSCPIHWQVLGIGDGNVNSMREADVYDDDDQLTQRGGRSLSSGVVGACHAMQIASRRGGNLDFGEVAQRMLVPEGFATGAAVEGLKGAVTTTKGFCTGSFFRVPPNASGVIVPADAADAALADELNTFTAEMRTQFNNESLFDLAKDEGVTIVCRNKHCGKIGRGGKRGPCCMEVSQTRCPNCNEEGRSKGCGSCAVCCEGCCPFINSTESSATSSTKSKRARRKKGGES